MGWGLGGDGWGWGEGVRLVNVKQNRQSRADTLYRL